MPKMVTDPVCGMEIDENEKGTVVAVASGKKSYFCSNECRNAFLEKLA